MIVYRTVLKSPEKRAPGKHTIVVQTKLAQPKPGSPVASDHFERAPFKFNGKIGRVSVTL